MRKYSSILFLSLFTVIFFSCRISYQFNGASIDYNLTKTIYIADFQNQAPMQYPNVAIIFNDEIKDFFTRNTRLIFTDENPDLELEGEITRYDLTPMSVKEDAYAAETRLTMTVRMRYRNNVNPDEDREESFTAYRDFDATFLFSDVQDRLDEELAKEIIDQIFNATMAQW